MVPGTDVLVQERHLRRIADRRRSLDDAAVRRDDAREDPQQRRLAGAVLAADADRLARMDAEIGPGQHRPASEALVQPRSHQQPIAYHEPTRFQ
jgi:hypothetical protein